MVVLTLLLPLVASATDLKLSVGRILVPRGTIEVAIYDESVGKDFPSNEKAIRTASFPVNGEGELKVELKGINPGRYAIALFHDENGNGRLDKDFFGIPKEPFGFSGNPKIYFGAPSFAKCAFNLVGESQALEVHLKRF